MRRAETFSVVNTIIALVIFGAVAIMFLAMANHEAFSGKLFQESVYATDNALLAEALQIVPTGTMRYAYLLDSTEFQFEIERGQFSVMSAERSGAPTIRQFGVGRDLEVSGQAFSPRMYELVRSPQRLDLRTVVQADACPMPGTEPSWPSTIHTSGESLAGTIVREALFDRVEPENFDHRSAYVGSLLRLEFDDTPSITHDGTPEMRILSCLLQNELAEQDLSVRIQTANRENPARIHLVVPQEEQEAVRQAAVCAFRTYATGGRDEC